MNLVAGSDSPVSVRHVVSRRIHFFLRSSTSSGISTRETAIPDLGGVLPEVKLLVRTIPALQKCHSQTVGIGLEVPRDSGRKA